MAEFPSWSAAHLAREINTLDDALRAEFLGPEQLETVDWRDHRLAQIVRFRLLTDPMCPFFDVSYVWGRLHDGTPVKVEVPFGPGDIRRKSWKSDIVRFAKRDRVYAKGLGLFEAVSILF